MSTAEIRERTGPGGREELLTIAEAVEKVKNLATAKFDETVELAIRLGSTLARPSRSCVHDLATRGHRQDQPRRGLRCGRSGAGRS